jgi:Glycosyl transferases group 1
MNRNSIQVWRDRALELAWTLKPQRPSRVHNLFPDSHRLTRVLIRWPSAYQWAPAAKWVNPVLDALRRRVRTETRDIPQPYAGVVLIEFINGQSKYDVAIDISDSCSINDDCARACHLYFKMQYSRDGYRWDHVVPGGYVPNDSSLYRFLPHLRSIRDRQVFSYDVYGRFGVEFAKDIRQRAVGILSEQKRFSYEGGLKKIRYSAFLREVARSRVCIDLPGNGEFCFRLFDYFAVGACVIGPRHRTQLPSPLVDRKHIVYTKDDLSDLVDLCAFYVENEEERESISRESRQFFDDYIHVDQLAAHYLTRCLERLA